ncbi:general transcription factor II-I repeat domain-containing protein 2 [Nephila pilipes]|uniref:General transcription factor II-I repeat domain-containing protein 2 n=1 Tax=Nephila pilipes TaxID=299642 RepID=A0A8X6MT57_NEPPI|nr:general transcription factor II-I repeat domain-containing protein 2 [Nephila pilipes]GFT46735.1 general transcription factor II-I repeat domain-containing protein 2 [Nephila pilipes]GFT51880.1 general transcription factor II-I repeat domain-containing protein 2 [Nephila pilipes]GFU20498.1 general transcription factor II-I repeat domain-containing protein 2 [Nephila pilipes]
MCFPATLASERRHCVVFPLETELSRVRNVRKYRIIFGFAFFTYLLWDMSNLNVQMQEKNQFIDDIWAHLKASKLKLHLFAWQLATKDLSHFLSKCREA